MSKKSKFSEQVRKLIAENKLRSREEVLAEHQAWLQTTDATFQGLQQPLLLKEPGTLTINELLELVRWKHKDVK